MVVFSANKDELIVVKKHFVDQQKKGVNDAKNIEELLSLGWTEKELEIILELEMKMYNKKILYRKSALFISLVASLFFIILFVVFEKELNELNYFFQLLVIFVFVMPMVAVVGFFTQFFKTNIKVSVMDRRVKLFFSRFSKIYHLREIFDHGEQYNKILKRNRNKIFLPVGVRSQFKLSLGFGEYKGRRFYLYVVKKFSHYEGNETNNPIYRYYIFYEFLIKKIPFHFALVKEGVIETHAKRMQNEGLKEGDFKDIDFPSREFNKKWKLRGSDKKLAYQIFGPHMKSLILEFDQKDFIGLEISDQSVMLSTSFSYPAVKRSPDDFKLLYEIAKQVERNYREVKW